MPTKFQPDVVVRMLLEDDEPQDVRSEVDRLLPTKTVRFRGNSMLNAAGVIAMAQNEWKFRSKKKKDWAMNLIKSWPGLDDAMYVAILNGDCVITEEGDDAIIVIKQY